MLLTKKNIVIVGGTSGIGFSAASAFVNEGANVIAIGRKPDRITKTQKILGNHGTAIQGNAADSTTAQKGIQLAVDEYGSLHGLYHVAGGSGRGKGDGPLHEISDEGWDYTLSTNLDAIFYSNRAAIKQFLKQSDGGTILNMSSVLGFSPSSKYFATHAYASTKAAVIGLTKSLASYYANQNIRFNVIAPGLVATPMSERAQSDNNIMDYIAGKQPLDGGRIGKPADLDGAAVYFMSDNSKFTTGQVLSVDGGWSVSNDQ